MAVDWLWALLLGRSCEEKSQQARTGKDQRTTRTSAGLKMRKKCQRQLPVLVSTVKSCSTGTCRRIHLMVIQKPSGKSWVWWCTKGKGKVNRCTALAPPFWFSSSFRLLLAYKLMMKRRASRREEMKRKTTTPKKKTRKKKTKGKMKEM